MTPLKQMGNEMPAHEATATGDSEGQRPQRLLDALSSICRCGVSLLEHPDFPETGAHASGEMPYAPE